MSVRVWVASRNAGKVAELQHLLGASFDLEAWPGRQLAEETGTSYLENALAKAEVVRDQTLDWVLADDSGLEVAALAGQPGVYSARYAGPAASDLENRTKLLAELSALPGASRLATFVAVLVLLRVGHGALAATGSCNGTIAEAERGVGGFGYDPLFISDELGITFAEATESAKAAVSHRGRAARRLMAELQRSGGFDPRSDAR
ncbi:MAG: RdgB/HAM1 family non-canonical purine NTP pyrophosphatase [Sulfobacillus sp.]